MEHIVFNSLILTNPDGLVYTIKKEGLLGNNELDKLYESGDGYEFLADQVIALDALNPQVASRLLTPLTRWKKFDSKRQALMQAQLLRIKAVPDLSKDVFEIVEKSTVQITG